MNICLQAKKTPLLLSLLMTLNGSPSSINYLLMPNMNFAGR